MRSTLFTLLLVFLVGCNPAQKQTDGRSLFALGPADFKDHKSETLTSTQATGGCTTVNQGDILFFNASGSISTTLGTVGPNGKSWGGDVFSLLNRPAFGLFGELGDSHFVIGEALTMIAPRSGCLTTLVNGCTLPAADGGFGSFDCTTTGSFTVDTFSSLDQGVTIATVPAVSDNTVSNTTTVTVDASQGWQPTGVMLLRGQKVFVSASGQFTGSGQQWTADGDDACIGGTAFPLDVRQCYRLYGQVGDTLVDLGKSGVFLSPGAGELKLTVNGSLGATTGSLSVSVGQGVVPARGLIEEDAQGFTQSATLTVNPDGNWLATGIHVHKGDPVVTSATGQLSGSAFTPSPASPNGVGAVGGYPYPLPNRPALALFLRVGSEPIFVGDQSVILAPDDGEVQLLINQTNWCSSMICTGMETNCVTAQSCATYATVTGSFSATVRAP